MGQKNSFLLLAGGTELKNLAVRNVNAAMLTVIHDSWFRRIRLANIMNEDVNWAVWIPEEAQIEEERQRVSDAVRLMPQEEYIRTRDLNAIEAHLAQIESQLLVLYQEYNRLAVTWNYIYYGKPKLKPMVLC